MAGGVCGRNAGDKKKGCRFVDFVGALWKPSLLAWNGLRRATNVASFEKTMVK